MSLTAGDLVQVREVVIEALELLVLPRFDRLEARMDSLEAMVQEQSRTLNEHSQLLNQHSNQPRYVIEKVDDIDGRLKAVEADIKELYARSARPIPIEINNTDFDALSVKDKLILLDWAVKRLADETGVCLTKD